MAVREAVNVLSAKVTDLDWCDMEKSWINAPDRGRVAVRKCGSILSGKVADLYWCDIEKSWVNALERARAINIEKLDSSYVCNAVPMFLRISVSRAGRSTLMLWLLEVLTLVAVKTSKGSVRTISGIEIEFCISEDSR